LLISPHERVSFSLCYTGLGYIGIGAPQPPTKTEAGNNDPRNYSIM